jgi:potassium-dependent mechanosensitive channel
MEGCSGRPRRRLPFLAWVPLLCLLAAAPLSGQTPQPAASQEAPPAPSQPQEPAPPAPKVAALPGPQLPPVAPVAPAQIAARSQDLGRLLQQILRRLGPDPDLDRIQAATTVRRGEIDARSKEAAVLMDGTPTLFELRDLENFWREMSRGSTAAKHALGQKAAAAERDLDQLARQEAVWKVTLAEVASQPGLLALSDRIQGNLGSIADVRAMAQDRLSKIVALQDNVVTLELQVTDLLDTVGQAMTAYQRDLWEPEEKPLWAPRAERLAEVGPSRLSHPAVVQDVHNILLFVENHELAFFVVMALALAIFLFTFTAGRRAPPPEGPPSFANLPWLFRRPVALATLVAATGLIFFMSKAPAALISLAGLMALLPYFRLFIPVVARPFRKPLVAFAAIYISFLALGMVSISPVLERELGALWAALAMATCAWFSRPKSVARMRELPRGSGVVAGVKVVGAFLLVAFLANVYGCFDLFVVLSQGAIYSFYLAVVLAMVVRLACGVIAVFLEGDTARLSFTVRERRDTILLWLGRGLKLVAVLVWVKSALGIFAIAARVNRPLEAFLTTPLVVGKAHITPADVLLFVLTFAAGVILAQILAFLLREELLPRMNLRRGLPEAVSTVVRYVLYFAVFLLAFSAAGFPMDKFTLLTGAFGVGIGFGLQNVVNNFVSGLILLFERPINVGDTVDVDKYTGVVSRIGIRSCTVRTLQGAEVIVPNSALVSNSVINWTLSDPRRRVEIPVGVAYGTDPNRVIELLVETAKGVPGVLPFPEPAAFFLGFGDSALQFEVRFWAPDQDAHIPLKSRVAVAVNDALVAASIEIPFPQRDLRVRSVDPQAARALGGPKGEAE